VNTFAKARLTNVAIRIRMPTFPESFMQIRAEVFAQSC